MKKLITLLCLSMFLPGCIGTVLLATLAGMGNRPDVVVEVRQMPPEQRQGR